MALLPIIRSAAWRRRERDLHCAYNIAENNFEMKRLDIAGAATWRRGPSRFEAFGKHVGACVMTCQDGWRVCGADGMSKLKR